MKLINNDIRPDTKNRILHATWLHVYPDFAGLIFKHSIKLHSNIIETMNQMWTQSRNQLWNLNGIN
jgi:hypothetical protein